MAVTLVAERAAEVADKLARVRALLGELDLDGVVLTRQNDVAWVSAGVENLIIRGEDPGLVWALVTPSRALLVTQNIEGPRIEAEEHAAELGFEVATFPWWEDAWERLVTDLVPAARLGNDGAGPGRSIAAELSALKADLSDPERARLRLLGADAAAAVEGPMRRVGAATTERELAAELVRALELARIFPSVLLVGGGERRTRFRHPTISGAPLGTSALAVLVGVRDGLNIALSRSVAIGGGDAGLAERHAHVVEVEAAEIAASRPGATWGEALQAGIDAYERLGYPGEWREHYQGGVVGYGAREFSPAPLAHPNAWTAHPVRAGQAAAWNPTIRGAKSEDTFIVGSDGPELVTTTGDWPTLDVAVDGLTIARPALLEL